MKYQVEHMQGTAGVDEKCIDCVIVEAHNALSALTDAFSIPDNFILDNDTERDIATLSDPDAANDSGKYCNYYMSSPEEGSDE